MPIYEFNCDAGHAFEALCEIGTKLVTCNCGAEATKRDAPSRISVRARGGDTLDKGEQYLAALHFGACVPDSNAPHGKRPPRTRGEVDPLLAANGLRRGTKQQFSETLQAKKEHDQAPTEIKEVEMPKERMDQTLAFMQKRRERFRQKYDSGEIPQVAELPKDVKSATPTAAPTPK